MLARMTSGSRRSSRVLKRASFASLSSTMASSTNLHPIRSSRLAVYERLATTISRRAGSSLRLSTALAMRPSRRSRTTSRSTIASTRTVGIHAWETTWAMPLPITPAPTMPTFEMVMTGPSSSPPLRPPASPRPSGSIPCRPNPENPLDRRPWQPRAPRGRRSLSWGRPRQ